MSGRDPICRPWPVRHYTAADCVDDALLAEFLDSTEIVPELAAYSPVGRFIGGVLLGLGGRTSDFEEILGKALEKAHRSRHTVRGRSVGEFLSWLRTVVRSARADHIRQAERQRKHGDAGYTSRADLRGDPSTAPEVVEQRKRTARLAEWLHEELFGVSTVRLSTLERDVLRGLYRGQPVAAIAERLGRSKRSVENAYAAGGRKLHAAVLRADLWGPDDRFDVDDLIIRGMPVQGCYHGPGELTATGWRSHDVRGTDESDS